MSFDMPPPNLPSDSVFRLPHDQSRASTSTPEPSWPYPLSLKSALVTTPPTTSWTSFPTPKVAFDPSTPFDSPYPEDSLAQSASWVGPSMGRQQSPPTHATPHQMYGARSPPMPQLPPLSQGRPEQYIHPSASHRMLAQEPQVRPASMSYAAQPYPYSSSASMSAMAPISYAPVSDRRMSTPIGHSVSPYAFHPMYAHHGYQGGHHGQRIHPAPPGMEHLYDDMRSDNNKPPRFRPTKEQLAILIGSYDRNKNPDAAGREALARMLGPDVRAKTLQIWFQNRRSKSRAKERESAGGMPRQLSISASEASSRRSSGAFDPFVLGGSGRKGSLADIESLKGMVHDNDPTLQIVPISVLSVSTWTRFLTPGLTASPDLCLAVRFQISSPEVFVYVSHNAETYRIRIPLEAPVNRHTACIASLESASNPTVNAEAVLVRFELASGICTYSSWNNGVNAWVETGDFSGGVVARGGRVEITGQRETLLPAFAKIHQYLYDAPLLTPVTFTNRQTGPASPITPVPTASTKNLSFTPLRMSNAGDSQAAFGSIWRFPASTTAKSANNTPIEPSDPRRSEIAGMMVRPGSMSHVKERSFSAPIVMPTEFEAGKQDLGLDHRMGNIDEGLGWDRMAVSANKWAGTPTGYEQHQQSHQHNHRYSDDSIREDDPATSWPFPSRHSVDRPTALFPMLTSAGQPMLTPSGPTFSAYGGVPTDHSRYSSTSSSIGKRGRNPSTLSLQSVASPGMGPFLVASTDRPMGSPPFVFDPNVGVEASAIFGDAKKLGDGVQYEDLSMEVLEE